MNTSLPNEYDIDLHHHRMFTDACQDMTHQGVWRNATVAFNGDRSLTIDATLPSGHPVRLTSDPDSGAHMCVWPPGRVRLDPRGVIAELREFHWRPGDPDMVSWRTCCQMVARLLADLDHKLGVTSQTP